MTAGIGKLLRDMFAAQQGNTVRETQNIAFDPRFREVDLSKIVEVDDNTDLKDQVACAADGCEVS